MRTIPDIITSGEFTGSPPYGYSAKDASGPTLLDGTEYNAACINDFDWGWTQAALKQAGIIPDGTPETEDASQILEALARILSPVGSVFEWNRNDDPATANARVLYLRGQMIARTSYPELDAACYVGDARNATADGFYHSDHTGAPQLDGLFLTMPDYRGYFPRGLDTTGAIDPGGVGRNMFDIQDDAFQGHWHDTSFPLIILLSGSGHPDGTGSGEIISTVTDPITDTVNGVPRTSSETRPKNRATKYVVRY